MPTAPTSRQRQVLRLVHDFAVVNGYAPSLAELRDGLRVSSTHTVVSHVRALERKGLLLHDVGTARSLRLTPAGRLALVGAA